MLTNTFFEEFGRVAHALAMQDGEAQQLETATLGNAVQELMQPFEADLPMDAAAISQVVLTPFKKNFPVKTQEEALDGFLGYLKREKVQLKHAQVEALTEVLATMAQAADFIRPNEQQFIDLFEAKVSALTEVGV